MQKSSPLQVYIQLYELGQTYNRVYTIVYSEPRCRTIPPLHRSPLVNFRVSPLHSSSGNSWFAFCPCTLTFPKCHQWKRTGESLESCSFQCICNSSLFLHASVVGSFIFLSDIPWYRYTTASLHPFTSRKTMGHFHLGLLWINMLLLHMAFLYGHKFLLVLGKHLGVELYGKCMFDLTSSCQTDFQSNCCTLCSHQQYTRTCQHLVFSFSVVFQPF